MIQPSIEFSHLRAHRAFVFGLLIAAATLVPTLNVCAAPPARAAAAEEKDPILQLFSKAEKLFQTSKFKEAIKSYAQLLVDGEKSGLFEENPASSALVHLRLASCYYNLKLWPFAEKELLIFLDVKKHPKGTDSLLGSDNNYRGIAQITLSDVYAKQKKWDDAIKLLATVTQRSNFNIRQEDRIRAIVLLTRVLEAKGDADEASAAVKKKIASDSLQQYLLPIIAGRAYQIPEVKDAAHRAVELYTKIGATKEARALSDGISSVLTGNPLDKVNANFRLFEIGDSLFEQAETENDKDRKKNLYTQSLSTYQEVLRANALNAILDDAIKIQENKVIVLQNSMPKPDDEQKAVIEKAEAEKARFMEVVENFRKSNDYNAIISYRIALCLLELKRPWEAYYAFRDIFDNNPKFSRMPTAHFFYIQALRDTHRVKEAQAACEDFLKKYPADENVGEVAVISGQISFDLGDFETAITQFTKTRATVKSLTVEYKEWIDWYICWARFQSVSWASTYEAEQTALISAIEKFISNYPKSEQREQMVYLRALFYFYMGKYKETMAGMNDYLKGYPKGIFRPDAEYRLALVYFGLKAATAKEAAYNNEQTRQKALKWLETYKNPTPDIRESVERQRAEIYTLLGDVHFRYFDDKSKDNTEEKKKENLKKAIDYYVTAAKAAQNNPQTFDFVTRELDSRLPSQGEWARMLDIYLTFYNWNPDAPKALGHLLQVLRAADRLGKTPEEKRAALEREGVKIPDEYVTKSAEEILGDAIVRGINDQKKENLEQLITNLAERVLRKARIAERAAKSDPERAAGATKIDPEKQILQLLKLDEGKATLLAQARGYFARAEVARLRSARARGEEKLRNEQLFKENIGRIANIFKPEELSPALLAVVIELLLEQKNFAKAETFADYILEHWRSSDYADYGFLGKGTVQLEQKKPKEALATLKEAVDGGILLFKEWETRLAYAQALTTVGGRENIENAKKELNALATNKDWRRYGVAAWALYYLGQIEEKLVNYNEAINFYNRASLAWKKHGHVTAKCYLRAAELYLNKKHDPRAAAMTIRDMLRPDNPASQQPEAAIARTILSRLPASAREPAPTPTTTPLANAQTAAPAQSAN
ncbi:MAG: hypothetical protein LBS59_05320 [Puniceicoccales bacterium]|jgi:tetratricopeptide (TPR) repeat protein|nr:hypothetical protein [Puniceicoccales bacterium]